MESLLRSQSLYLIPNTVHKILSLHGIGIFLWKCVTFLNRSPKAFSSSRNVQTPWPLLPSLPASPLALIPASLVLENYLSSAKFTSAPAFLSAHTVLQRSSPYRSPAHPPRPNCPVPVQVPQHTPQWLRLRSALHTHAPWELFRWQDNILCSVHIPQCKVLELKNYLFQSQFLSQGFNTVLHIYWRFNKFPKLIEKWNLQINATKIIS